MNTQTMNARLNGIIARRKRGLGSDLLAGLLLVGGLVFGAAAALSPRSSEPVMLSGVRTYYVHEHLPATATADRSTAVATLHALDRSAR